MLNSGEKIIGTGIGRLHKDKLEGLEVLETTNISANALIALFNSSSGKQFFKKTTAEELESNYLSSSQVNNTSV
ncbi:hypothetical protein [Gracilimonas sediminicola]